MSDSERIEVEPVMKELEVKDLENEILQGSV